MAHIRRRLLATITALSMAMAPMAAGPVAAESPSPGAQAIATDDTYTTAEDTPLHVAAPGVLSNDNPGLATCVIAAEIGSASGSVDMQHDGSFTFTPASNFHGDATFTYSIQATGDAECSGPMDSEATVTVTVSPVNDAPTAAPDSFTALRDHTLNVAAPGVLGNDSDVDGDALTAVKASLPAHGVVTLAADGGFSYTPATGYIGPDAFAYKASDGSAESLQQIVRINVVDVPPTASPTPVPTATPVPPTATPEASPSDEPAPSDGGLPTEFPVDTRSVASGSPSPSPVTGPVSSQGGPPILAIGALMLLIALLAIAGVYFVRSQGAGAEQRYEPAGPRAEALDDEDPPPA